MVAQHTLAVLAEVRTLHSKMIAVSQVVWRLLWEQEIVGSIPTRLIYSRVKGLASRLQNENKWVRFPPRGFGSVA